MASVTIQVTEIYLLPEQPTWDLHGDLSGLAAGRSCQALAVTQDRSAFGH